MAKKCIFLDYNIRVFVEKVDCDKALAPGTPLKVCSPRNFRLIATGENDNPEQGISGNPQRIVLTGLYLMHVIFDAGCIKSGSIKITMERAIECGNGCDPGYYSVPTCYKGSGMMLYPGEYTISVKDQVAHCATEDNIDQDYQMTLLFEPVNSDIVDATLYNNACVR